MNTLHLADTGGRPLSNDDLLTLQDLHGVRGLPALLAGLGPCVVSGCRLSQTGSQYNVGPGVVWDGSVLLDFPGQANAALPGQFVPSGTTVVDEQPYQTGGTKPTIVHREMTLGPVLFGGGLRMETTGAVTFWHRVQERTRALGEVQHLANLAATDYDPTGKGVGPALGWALCNGQNDTADLRGLFVVGQDAGRADYDTVGKTGGEERHRLSVPEMPSHSHTTPARITDGGASFPFTAAKNSSPNASGSAIGIDPTGGGQAHENRPPFYVLAMRQWVGF